jgi:NAD-dependent deacetylase
MPSRLVLDGDTRLLVLTGAGVSAESGIPTFRAAGGLWETHPVEKVATPEGFEEDPELVWRFYSERRAQAQSCQPNPGHRALLALEERLGPRFLLVTQNVDGLHRRAGSRRLIEIHGCLFETRCSACDRPPFEDARAYERAPRCTLCERRGRPALLRPNVVWFGEYLDPEHLQAVERFLEQSRGGRLVFLAAGTSGAVHPASGFVDRARLYGAETWLVNAEPADNASRFQHFVQGRSGERLPELLGT